MRVFKHEYASIWVADHVGSDAARNQDKVRVTSGLRTKASVDGGQVKAAKVDDFLMLHRLANHPSEKYITQVHVQKVRDKETGGDHTDKDDPVKIQINMGYCGFTCNGQDPVDEYWKRLKQK
jgi:hypothetical protein